jgi:hypothetical protein
MATGLVTSKRTVAGELGLQLGADGFGLQALHHLLEQGPGQFVGVKPHPR